MSDFSNDTVYELNIGKSFLTGSKSISYHQFKYDFTPAAIDKNQDSKVTIGSNNEVTVDVPHIEGSAEKFTQFTGNKQPCSNKECILIYDPKTGTFTLERLETNFFLKRNRLVGSTRAAQLQQRSVTPTNEKNAKKVKLDPAEMSGGGGAGGVNNTSISKKDDNGPPPPPPQAKSRNSLNTKSTNETTLRVIKETRKEEQTIQPIETNTKSCLDDLKLSDSDSDDSEL